MSLKFNFIPNPYRSSATLKNSHSAIVSIESSVPFGPSIFTQSSSATDHVVYKQRIFLLASKHQSLSNCNFVQTYRICANVVFVDIEISNVYEP